MAEMKDCGIEVAEVDVLGPEAMALFRKTYKVDPPATPRHFVTSWHDGSHSRIAAYVHYEVFEQGVFLCGGLCVDSSVYRAMSPVVKAAIASRGSLSRMSLEESIDALGPKRAVFGYTGNVLSRRDAFALGFQPTSQDYLIVQWHDEIAEARARLVERLVAHGPF